MTHVTSVEPMTPKPNGFRALGVETPPKDLLAQVNKATKLNLAIFFFHFFIFNQIKFLHLLMWTLNALWGKRSSYSVKIFSMIISFFFMHYANWLYKNKVLASVRIVCSKVRIQVRGRFTGNCVSCKNKLFLFK